MRWGNPDFSFDFTPEYFYSLANGSPDSIFVRLEYVSDPDEDVGDNSACVGRGFTEFRVYNTPPPPTFDYGSAAVYANPFPNSFGEFDTEEVLYCEGATSSPTPIEIDGPQPDETYRWYGQDPITLGRSSEPLRDGSSYTPDSEDISGAVPGDGIGTYVYFASRIRYTDLEAAFQGCESEEVEVYLTVVGTPEVEISRIAYSRVDALGQPARNSAEPDDDGSDRLPDPVIDIDNPQVCIGAGS